VHIFYMLGSRLSTHLSLASSLLLTSVLFIYSCLFSDNLSDRTLLSKYWRIINLYYNYYMISFFNA
jgi:hypothetical protein